VDALPTVVDDPSAGMSVVIDVASSATGLDVTASGLSIDLAAGEYWIGLTPHEDFGGGGQEFHLSSGGLIGDRPAWRNPANGFGFGPGWQDTDAVDDDDAYLDAAITVGGVIVPAPGAVGLLGVAGFGALRRRR
jgi:hypothetical protein